MAPEITTAILLKAMAVPLIASGLFSLIKVKCNEIFDEAFYRFTLTNILKFKSILKNEQFEF